MQAVFKQLTKLLLSALWLGLMVYGFYYVYEVVRTGLESNTEVQWPAAGLTSFMIASSVVLLMMANWVIEAIKWRRSIEDIERISLFRAIKATLVGVSVSTWMPNRLGEYLGKVFYVKPSHRVRGAISALYVSYTQIIATLFFGLLGGIYFLLRFQGQYNIIWAILSIVVVLGSMIAFLAFKDRIIQYFRVRNKVIKLFMDTITRYSLREAWFFISLSALRFIVFTVQYVLALEFFGLQVSVVDSFMLISLIYGLQTIIPATALSGLGIRGTLSVFFFSYLTSNELAILSASYGIWVINLLVPSILGWFAMVFSPVKVEVRNYVLQFVRAKIARR